MTIKIFENSGMKYYCQSHSTPVEVEEGGICRVCFKKPDWTVVREAIKNNKTWKETGTYGVNHKSSFRDM